MIYIFITLINNNRIKCIVYRKSSKISKPYPTVSTIIKLLYILKITLIILKPITIY